MLVNDLYNVLLLLVVSKFLTALKEEGVIDEASLSDAHLSLIYDPLKQQVEESLQSQQQLVAKIQEAHQAFVQECGHDSSGRDEVLGKLASSYDAYIELESNLTEGSKVLCVTMPTDCLIFMAYSFTTTLQHY